MKNIFLQLFSIAVAVLLWYFVNSESNLALVGFSASIEVKDLPQSQVITAQSHRQAQITVKGPSFLVSKLSATPPLVRVRLPKELQGRYLAPLLKSEIDLPPSVQIVSIEPAEVKFSFDKLATKRVAVVVPRIGALGESYIVHDVEIAPSEVQLTGPESELASITSIETYPLDLRSIKEDFSRNLNIRLPGPHLDSNITQVTVDVDIDLVILERKFIGIPIEIRSESPNKDLTIQPNTITVDVNGPRELVKSLQSSNIRAFVNLDSQSDNKTLALEVEVPKGAHVTKLDPAEVKLAPVKVKQQKVKKKS
jgi:YbbR-like protein